MQKRASIAYSVKQKEKKISKLEDRPFEITQSEDKKEWRKPMGLSNNIKWNYIHIIGILEKE